jgi:hypothetical protein
VFIARPPNSRRAKTRRKALPPSVFWRIHCVDIRSED